MDSGLAVALLPESSVLNSTRVRPVDPQVLAGEHLLSINLIHASTFNPRFLEPLADWIGGALRAGND